MLSVDILNVDKKRVIMLIVVMLSVIMLGGTRGTILRVLCLELTALAS